MNCSSSGLDAIRSRYHVFFSSQPVQHVMIYNLHDLKSFINLNKSSNVMGELHVNPPKPTANSSNRCNIFDGANMC